MQNTGVACVQDLCIREPIITYVHPTKRRIQNFGARGGGGGGGGGKMIGIGGAGPAYSQLGGIWGRAVDNFYSLGGPNTSLCHCGLNSV